MRPLAILMGLALAVAACSSSDEGGEAPAAGSAAAGASPSRRAPRFPASPDELPTSDAAIALGNLDAQILGYENARKRQPTSADWLIPLSSLYDARGQAIGRIADYETALALADEAVRLAPADGAALLARAAARARFHRFADAMADLDAAAAHGAPADRVDGARAAILSATGREPAALATRQRL